MVDVATVAMHWATARSASDRGPGWVRSRVSPPGTSSREWRGAGWPRKTKITNRHQLWAERSNWPETIDVPGARKATVWATTGVEGVQQKASSLGVKSA